MIKFLGLILLLILMFSPGGTGKFFRYFILRSCLLILAYLSIPLIIIFFRF